MTASAQTPPKAKANAILVGMNKGLIYDDCHKFTPPADGEETMVVATVTFNGETVKMNVKGGEETAYSLNEYNPLVTSFAHTFTLQPHQDPANLTCYYSTFFTSEVAYKVPTGVTAYTGAVDGSVLKLAAIGNGVIPQSEAVILKATDNSIELLPSATQLEASSENDLEGTDVEKKLGDNQYALSRGENGVGFYLWNNKTIGANKAYLTLSGAAAASRAFTFDFGDGPTTGTEASPTFSPEGNDMMYDLNGMRVNGNYTKGFIIKEGKTIYHK